MRFEALLVLVRAGVLLSQPSSCIHPEYLDAKRDLGRGKAVDTAAVVGMRLILHLLMSALNQARHT